MLSKHLLDVENEPLGSRYGAALHRALFHGEMPENIECISEGELGSQTLKTGFQRALARSEDSEGLRLQFRINTEATEIHHYKWEYLVPVLFMRLPDGKLFDISTEDLQQHASNAKFKAVPLQQISQLAESVATPFFSHDKRLPTSTVMSQAIVDGRIKMIPPSPIPDTHTRLFSLDDQNKMRWALVQAAQDHRQHKARRSILFLRSLARVTTAKLLHHSRLRSLSTDDFQKQVWDGGYVEWDNFIIKDIQEGGPKTDYLIAGEQPLTIFECRTYCRSFDAEGHSTAFSVRHSGNLIWSDERHEALLEGHRPTFPDRERLINGLERLIYNPGQSHLNEEMVK